MIAFAAVLLCVALAGCSGVSQGEYDSALGELDEARETISTAAAEYDILSAEYETAKAELEALTAEHETLEADYAALSEEHETLSAEYAAYQERMAPYEELEEEEAQVRQMEAEAALAAAEEEAAAQAAAEEAEREEKERLGYDTGITYDQLARTPDDYITVYGLSVGLISYDSTMGGVITIPGVLVKKIDQ